MRDFNLICVGELMIHLWISIDTMIKKTHTRDLRENTHRWQATVREREDPSVSDDELTRKTQSFYLLFIVVCCFIVVSVLTDVLCLKVKHLFFFWFRTPKMKFSLIKWELSFFVQYRWTFFFTNHFRKSSR